MNIWKAETFYKRTLTLFLSVLFLKSKINNMKNTILKFAFLIALFFIVNQVSAQKFMMENEKISYDDKSRTAVKITMQPKSSEVKDEWEDWLEDRYDTKVKGNGFFRKKDILTAKEVLIPSISSDKINVFAQILKRGDGSQMFVFATLADKTLITPETHPIEYRVLENISLDFSSDLLVEYYRDRVSDSKEAVAELQEKRTELKEDLTENKEEIVKLKQENINLENKLDTKGGEIETAAQKLEAEKKKLNALNKKLEKEKKEKKKKEN